MSGILTFIYGVVIIIALYMLIRMLYSVYYTPGSTTVYNSPVSQTLFPGATNKLFPTWGYNQLGMYKEDPTKFGQGQFWPESGKGFVPNKYGSGGPSPSGGMRGTDSNGNQIPVEVPIGHWGGQTYEPVNKVSLDIYDNSSQHVKYVTDVGWWNS